VCKVEKQSTTRLSAIYFPFTWITNLVLETLLRVFPGVVVYQPVGCTVSEDLDSWVKQCRLEVRVPLAGVTDERALAASIKDMHAWATQYPDADMAYLKHAANRLCPAQPVVPELASHIKGSVKKTPRPVDDPDFVSQLFLRLAHDHDQQVHEMNSRLKTVGEKNRALEAFFRLDSPDESPIMPQGRTPMHLKSDPGAVMTTGRMFAWSRLFCRAPVQSGILVTDSPAVWSDFLEDMDEAWDLGCFEVPDAQDQSADNASRDAAEALFTDILTSPWDRTSDERTTQALERIFVAQGSGSAGVQSREDLKPTLHWNLIPNIDTAALLMRRYGIGGTAHQEQRICHTLVGFLNPGVIY